MSTLLLALTLAAPHANLQVYFQTQVSDARLQQAVFQKVAKVWAVPAAKPKPGKKAVVQVVLSSDGKVMSATVGLESGSPQWDRAALKAVHAAAPFPKTGATSVEVHFHFGWGG